MPRFSIVLPCFNAASTLPATINSIAAQSCQDWELICVDDGSTDATLDIITERATHDPRIHAVSNPGKGPSDARNHGALEIARGEIIAFCDADDLWSPTKLEEQDRAFADLCLDATFGQTAFFQDRPDTAKVYSTVPAGPVTIPMLLGENPVCTMSNMSVRRRAFLATGGFDTDMVHNEDLDWLIRLVGSGADLRGVDRTQVWYRTSRNGLSSNLAAMRLGRQQALETAARFGFEPDARAEAIHLRYLARRVLRLNGNPGDAIRLVAAGLANSPSGFLLPVRRGAATAIAAFVAPFLPNGVRKALFTR